MSPQTLLGGLPPSQVTKSIKEEKKKQRYKMQVALLIDFSSFSPKGSAAEKEWNIIILSIYTALYISKALYKH